MDKITFVTILEASILSFDGVEEKDIIEKYGLNPELTRIGVRLCSYLKAKDVGERNE